MSYYYNYYIGYEKDNKIYPIGPYDNNGKIHAALCKSSSFASPLHERFYMLHEKQVSDELRKEFEYEDYQGKKELGLLKVLPLAELLNGDIVLRGYCLVQDIINYLKPDSYDDFCISDLIYNMLTPEQFSFKAKAEMEGRVAKKKSEIEEEDLDNEVENEEDSYSCADYAYFSFIDTCSEEYESYVLRLCFDMFEFSPVFQDKNVKPVVILSEG